MAPLSGHNSQNRPTHGPTHGPQISLCMIVKNEAEALPVSLGSLGPGDPSGLIAEKIILDTGSTDETRAIAQSLGCQTFSYAWNNDFAAARNASLAPASCDWILVLDADEQLLPNALASIQPLLQQPNILAINLLRQEVGASQSPYSLVSRLFRRHPALQFRRPYHAMIDDSLAELLHQEPHWQVVDTAHPSLRHDGYRPGAIAAQHKFERARQAMESYWAQYPNDTYCCAKLGALYGEQGDWPRGIALLERALQQETVDEPVRYELHYHLAIAQAHQGNAEAAADHYQAALATGVPEIVKLGAYNNLAALLQGEGLVGLAQELYEQAIAIDPRFATAHYNLGKLKREQGDLPGAIAAYETALQLTPDIPEIHQNLGVALLKAGAIERSRAAFGRAIALYQPQHPEQALQLQQQLKALGIDLGTALV